MEHEADVFSREPNGLIALRVTQDEWNELLFVLGYKGGEIMRGDDEPMFNRVLRLVNRLNAGNPDFIPYQIIAGVPAAETQP